MTHKATLVMKRETKGAVLFEEVDSNGAPTVELCGNVYIRKSALGASRPTKITLTVETV